MQVLKKDFKGEILVGQAVIISTENSEIPWMVSAPTMRLPSVVANTVNAYLAFRAALRVVRDTQIDTLLCPGMGTLTGKIPFEKAAKQMLFAYLTYQQCSSLTLAIERKSMFI